jgi:hypothetical protein
VRQSLSTLKFLLRPHSYQGTNLTLPNQGRLALQDAMIRRINAAL